MLLIIVQTDHVTD